MKVKATVLFIVIVGILVFYYIHQSSEVGSTNGITDFCARQELIITKTSNITDAKVFIFDCNSNNDETVSQIVDSIKLHLREKTSVEFIARCKGHNNTNKFLRLKEILVGYRKICKNDNSSCRNAFLIDRQDNSENWVNWEDIRNSFCSGDSL